MRIGIQNAAEKRGLLLTEILIREGLYVTALNDGLGTEAIEKGLMGRASGQFDVNNEGHRLTLNKRIMSLTGNSVIEDIPWDNTGVKIVEIGGEAPMHSEVLQAHSFSTDSDGDTINDTGVEYIISSVGSPNADHLVFGLNHEKFSPKPPHVITVGSPPARAMAFPIKAIMDSGTVKLSGGEYFAIVPKTMDEGREKTKLPIRAPGIGAEVSKMLPGLRLTGYVVEEDWPEHSHKAGWVMLRLHYSDQEDISTAELHAILEGAESSMNNRLGIFRRPGYRPSNRIDIAHEPPLQVMQKWENPGLHDIAIREFRNYSSVLVLPKCTSGFLQTGEPGGCGEWEQPQGVGTIELLIGYNHDTASAIDQALLTKYIIGRMQNE
jgi:hypothetical protein